MDIIKTTLVATSIGLLATYLLIANKSKNSDVSIAMRKRFVKPEVSSTKFNNSSRYSLEKLKLNLRKLETFKSLRKNWNGYEGEIIKSELIDAVKKIISNMEYQPQVFPTGRGSIQIENYINDKNFYEIEISDNEIFLYKSKDGKELEKEIKIDEIEKYINDLYE